MKRKKFCLIRFALSILNGRHKHSVINYWNCFTVFILRKCCGCELIKEEKASVNFLAVTFSINFEHTCCDSCISQSCVKASIYFSLLVLLSKSIVVE